MHERHNQWKEQAITDQLSGIPDSTHADRMALQEQLKIRAIIHANLLCKVASSGVDLTYQMVKDLEH